MYGKTYGEITTALIGYGYWGPKLARVLDETSQLIAIHDGDPQRLWEAENKYPSINCTSGGYIDADAVIIATPPATHAEIATDILENGQHVFVEKPLASSVADALKLYNLSKNYTNQVCCVGHTFLFSPEIRLLKKKIDEGIIGDLHIINTYRLNLGRYQPDGIKLDLLPHDISIIEYLVGSQATLTSETIAQVDTVESIGSVMFRFEDSSVVATSNISWCHTDKTRKLIAVGSKGTLEYDMSEPGIITWHRDRIVQHNNPGTLVRIETDSQEEPLKAEIEHFLGLITGDVTENRISFSHGYSVVRALHGISTSL